MGKKTFLAYKSSKGSDQTANPCSLIVALAACTHYVGTLRNLKAENEGPNKTAWIHSLVGVSTVDTCIRMFSLLHDMVCLFS